MRLASVSDVREAARRQLPRLFFDYIEGGAFSQSGTRSVES
jgi:L-lactate dehydrogenase (cytochrome)